MEESEIDDFNQWHRNVCKDLIDHYGDDKLVLRQNTKEAARLTYGQAQKWLNMTLKYLWLLNRLGLMEGESVKAFIDTYGKSFHVPLDSYVLRYVAKQQKSKSKPFPEDNGLSGDFSEAWKKFGSAWSHITDAKAYYEYQEALAKALPEGETPLEWELVHWHKALKYYDGKDEE